MDHEPTEASEPPDLDAIAADLADVETALAQLDDGSYFTETDAVGGSPPAPAELLARHPTTDRAPDSS